jgi:hypothetical protein
MSKKEEKILDLRKIRFFISVFISLIISLLIGSENIAFNLELPPGPLLGFYNPIDILNWAFVSLFNGDHLRIIVHGVSLSVLTFIMFSLLLHVFFYVEKYCLETNGIA